VDAPRCAAARAADASPPAAAAADASRCAAAWAADASPPAAAANARVILPVFFRLAGRNRRSSPVDPALRGPAL